MISIHLRRTGAKKDPHYRVVVTDSKVARDGAFIEILGHYHPRFEPAKVVLDVDKTKAWIAKGAQPSDTVKSLLRKVESGAVDVEQPVAPSRHRDATKQAEVRAAAPKPEPDSEPEPQPEPEPGAETSATDGDDVAEAEASDAGPEEAKASAEEASEETEAPAGEASEEAEAPSEEPAENREEDKE